MPYLIDGHNLIGQTPGLSLDDPEDEAKLTNLVKRWCMREQRTATIIFDQGFTAGESQLTNKDVKVVFASSSTIADELIIKRINSEKNPTGLIVVTSDQRIAEAARRRSMTVRAASEFGRALLATASGAATPEKEKGLNPNEVAEWEALFKKK